MKQQLALAAKKRHSKRSQHAAEIYKRTAAECSREATEELREEKTSS